MKNVVSLKLCDVHHIQQHHLEHWPQEIILAGTVEKETLEFCIFLK